MKKWFASVLMFAAVSSWAQAPAGNAASPMATPPQAKGAEAKAAVKVEKIVVGTGVENREAVGAATAFDAAVGQVSCWVKLAVAEPPAKVKFVWSLGGKQVYEHPLDIKSSGRWWAAKKVSAGSWKVEVQSENNESLGSVEFTVSAEAKAAAPAPAPAPAAK
jgi:hypothetical protein